MPIVGGVIVVAAIVAGIAMFTNSGSKPHNSQTSSATTAGQYKVVKACDALTLPAAQAVLGSGTKAGAANGKSDSASADVAVSTCSYSGSPGLTAQDTKTVTLLARSAKTAAGAESNESVFGKNKPVGKQDVSGVGDAAFWDAQLSQLDILVGHNWYIIGNMSGTQSDSGTLDVSRAVYEQIKTKL